MSEKEIITLNNIAIGYSRVPILDTINLKIGENEFWGIIGSNGGGKTTLLKTIIGLIPKLSGTIHYSNNTSFGYVPQNESFDEIFPVSVYELVMMGRYGKIGYGKTIGQEDEEIVNKTLAKVSIQNLKDKPFRSLSGGEKQRALIARAIAGEPSVLVLDEPTASVDIKGEYEIMELVSEIREENQFTVLIVSHYLNTISNFADRIILIDKDRGIFETGAVDNIINSKKLAEIFGINAVERIR